MADEHQSPVSARASVGPNMIYRGELPPEATAAPTRAPAMTESAWRNVALTLAVVLLIGSGGVVIFWPRGTAGPTVAQPTDAASVDPSASGSAPGANGLPSGVPMPGDITGWKRTFAEDFTGDLEAQWGTYEGSPSGDPGGWFNPSHVTQADGKLIIRGYRENTPNGTIYATGGINNGKSFAQTYGKYEFRFRMDAGYGINYVFLLWPANEAWPPEINIAEDNGLGRNIITSTMHYGTPETHDLINRRMDGPDFTQWHTVGLEWTKDRLVFTLDGNTWSTIESDKVPAEDMVMAIQSQAWFCGSPFSDCPNSTTPSQVNLEVDWAVAYAAA